MHKEHHGFLFGAIAAIANALTALFAKLAIEVPVEMMVFARFALGVPILIWIIHQGHVQITWPKFRLHIWRALFGLSALYTFLYAVKLIPLVNAVTLNGTAPLFMPFIALIWLKLVVSKQRIIAVTIGFIGILILLRPTADLLTQAGSLMALAAGVLGAITLMGVRQLSKTESTATILTYYFLISTIVSFFPMLFHLEWIQEGMQWFYLFMVGLCALVFQYTLTRAYTHAPATKVSATNYLAVVFGGLFGWLVFGEKPDIWVWMGTVLIIVGALIALLDKSKPRKIGA